jgi:hypothetical protein
MTARWVRGVLLLSALILAGCGKTPGPGEEAKVFFDRLAAGRVDEAYDSAAFGFQIQKTRIFFAAMVQEMELVNIASATFAAPQMDGRTATVRGEFTTKAGVSFALVVTLIQDAGAWRVYALKSPRDSGGAQDRYRLAGGAVGLAEAGNRQPAPDDETIRKLIVDVMMRFDEAVRAKSFNDFFDHISRRWQLQLVHSYEAGFDYDTAMRRPLEAGEHELGSAHFDRVFRAFMERSVDLSNLGDIAPVLAPPPRLSTEGLLLVSGYFPTQPRHVNFALKFIYESPSWRLFGLDVNLDDPPSLTR